ncbi:MAG: hypothetical protein OJF47_002448 [Nitrospira sp.]|nr:MAG: hypothetical protein OJF47_002448 [Nitrospira sp.]
MRFMSQVSAVLAERMPSQGPRSTRARWATMVQTLIVLRQWDLC